MGADSKAGDDDEWQTTVDASYAKKGSEVETCSLALCASHETTVVDVSHNALLDVGLALLLDPLKRCRNLTRLCLAHCGLTDGAVGSLSTLVAALERTLTELDVGHNNFSLEGCGALGDVLRTNRVMQRCRVRLFFIPMDRLRGSEDLVDISKDIFRPADGAFISRICVDGDVGTLKLNHAPLPLRLLINGCHHRGRPNAVELVSQRLRTEDALVISAALEFARAPGLEVLKLDDNDLGADAALALARALRTNLFLKRLSVNKCRLTDDGERREGVSAVAEALEFNDSLRSLELRENGIDDGAAADFARCVKENRGLTRLDLRANDFDDGPGGTALGMALTKNDFVTVFNGMDLFGTSEHREFRQTVVHGGASVGPGPATSINLARNQEDGFQVYEVVFLASRMRAAGHLRDLDLDANDLGAAHLVALCGGLSHARSLESLSLAANRLCDVYTDKTHRVRGNYDGSGLEALAAYLAGAEAPPTLRRLDLRRSHVDDRAHALARAIYTSEHLALDVLNGIEAVCDGAPVVALDVSGRRHGAASYEVAFVARAVRDSNTLLSLEAKSCALCGASRRSKPQGATAGHAPPLKAARQAWAPRLSRRRAFCLEAGKATGRASFRRGPSSSSPTLWRIAAAAARLSRASTFRPTPYAHKAPPRSSRLSRRTASSRCSTSQTQSSQRLSSTTPRPATFRRFLRWRARCRRRGRACGTSASTPTPLATTAPPRSSQRSAKTVASRRSPSRPTASASRGLETSRARSGATARSGIYLSRATVSRATGATNRAASCASPTLCAATGFCESSTSAARASTTPPTRPAFSTRRSRSQTVSMRTQKSKGSRSNPKPRSTSALSG